MSGDYDPIEQAGPPARSPAWRRFAGPGIAFLLGLGVMGYLLSHWEGGARLLGIASAPAEAEAPRPAPEPLFRIETPPPAAPAPGRPLTDTELASRMAALEARFGQLDNSSQVAVGGAERTEALVVAFAARRAIERGVALGFLERMLQQRFGATQPRAVALIIAAARQPVTLAALEAELERLAPQLMGAPPEQSWWGAFRSELGSLVVLRHADTPSSEPSQRLARAKRWLAAGEVAAAVAEVQRLPGEGHGRDWAVRARRLALARQALDAIETAALLEPHAPAASTQVQPAPARPAPRPSPQNPARPTSRPQRPSR